jgi:hypothetical protein
MPPPPPEARVRQYRRQGAVQPHAGESERGESGVEAQRAQQAGRAARRGERAAGQLQRGGGGGGAEEVLQGA